jgi:Uma2 family endonuclease
VSSWHHGEVTTLPRGREFTRADLDRMPDDGNRYELIDGLLVVSPSPTWQHQRVVGRLYRILADACPDDLEVFVAPLDVVLGDDTVVVPDVLVARRADLGERDLRSAPMLVVEVLSPSTARADRWLKWSRYESAGTRSYWIVDPVEMSLTAWDLLDGTYVQVAQVTGDASWTAAHPFPVTVIPRQLVSD